MPLCSSNTPCGAMSLSTMPVAPMASAVPAALKSARTSGLRIAVRSMVSDASAAAGIAIGVGSTSSAAKLAVEPMLMVARPSGSRSHSISPAAQAAAQYQKRGSRTGTPDATAAAKPAAMTAPTNTCAGLGLRRRGATLRFDGSMRTRNRTERAVRDASARSPGANERRPQDNARQGISIDSHGAGAAFAGLQSSVQERAGDDSPARGCVSAIGRAACSRRAWRRRGAATAAGSRASAGRCAGRAASSAARAPRSSSC